MSAGTSIAQRTAAGSPGSAPRPVAGGRPIIQLTDASTRLVLGPLPGSAGCARDHARAVLTTWSIRPDVIETALLIVSELVTNAVEATRRLNLTVPAPIRLRLADRGRYILIEVADADIGTPGPQVPETYAERGRGLMLVDALSAGWGTYPRDEPGKVVWAEVVTDPAVLPRMPPI